MSEKPKKAVSPLAEVELEVLEEGREWMRRRIEKKLQRLADRQGAISPPQPSSVAPGDDEFDHAAHDGR